MSSQRCGVASILLLVLSSLSPLSAGDIQPVGNPGEYLAAVLPVVGSTPGNFGSYFKTTVQIHNPNSEALTFRAVYHPAGRSGVSGDPSLVVTVLPRGTRLFEDMLPAMGVATGLGSLDVYLPNGVAAGAVAVVRVFNDAGASGTSGFTEGFVALEDAIASGQSGYMIGPPDLSVYRFNVGVRSLGQGASLRVTTRNGDGVVTRTTTRSYAPNYFEQVSADAFLGAALAGNESLTIEVTAGAAVVYGATTDNRTNDASYQQAVRLVD